MRSVFIRCRRWGLAAALAAGAAWAQPVKFEAVTVADGLRMGYQLTVCDVNQDGKPDLIVVDERSTELGWYENPGAGARQGKWERRVLAREVPRAINVACGAGEIMVGHHFETVPAKSKGTVLRLKPGADLREPWVAEQVDAVPTIHRLRWARTREGRKLLVSPLVGAESEPPLYAGATPIYVQDAGGTGHRVLYNGLTGIVHSVHPYDWDGDGRDEVLTSSFDGIHLLKEGRKGEWTGRKVAAGDRRECPQCGTSELRVGRLGKRRFLAAIEPWHGNQLVVYPAPEAGLKGKEAERVVVDERMLNGHALAVGDFDGDGRDEIVTGFRGKGYQVAVFTAEDGTGRKWRREVIDETVAAADCQVADLDGDGRVDLACSGASTGNVRVYFNRGK